MHCYLVHIFKEGSLLSCLVCFHQKVWTHLFIYWLGKCNLRIWFICFVKHFSSLAQPLDISVSRQLYESLLGRFIYILDSSNSSSFIFWSSKLASSSRSNWTGIWTNNSNGSWTDKHSSHFSTAKENKYDLDMSIIK